jgi:hypothetical protein
MTVMILGMCKQLMPKRTAGKKSLILRKREENLRGC